MIVLKFGGTSVGNSCMIKRVTSIVSSYLPKKPIVVVSALSGITDSLINLAKLASLNSSNFDQALGKLEEIKTRHFKVIDELGLERNIIKDETEEIEVLTKGIHLLKELTPRTLDRFMSFGEIMSSKIVASYMQREGINAKAYKAYDIGFVTDSNFGNAEILQETEYNLKKFFEKIDDEVPVITGFIAKNKRGEITTLGRGGSDYTATIIASAINAEEVQIWTDVDGIMTADPRIVKDAKTLEIVSFEEASELAFLGAKVLHPKTLLPAIKKNIPVKIKNTMNPNSKGTLIVKDINEEFRIASIACKRNIKLINIFSPKMFLVHGFLHKIFEIFDKHKVSVDMISTSEVNISLTLDGNSDVSELINELSELAEVELRDKRASISIVGKGLSKIPGIAGKIFSVLSKINVNVEMISAGSSNVSISFVVKEEYLEDTVRALHSSLFLDRNG